MGCLRIFRRFEGLRMKGVGSRVKGVKAYDRVFWI